MSIESHLSLPVVTVGKIRTEVDLAVVDGDIEATLRQDDAEVTQKLGEAPAGIEGKIDVLNNVSNAPPQLFEAAAGMHSGVS